MVLESWSHVLRLMPNDSVMSASMSLLMVWSAVRMRVFTHENE